MEFTYFETLAGYGVGLFVVGYGVGLLIRTAQDLFNSLAHWE